MTLYCFVPPFRKAKFCGVPSRAIVKVGIVVGKKKSAGHCSTAQCLLAIISLNSINQPIFAMEKRCVFFAVRTALTVLIFHTLLCGNSAREHNTAHSTMAKYI
jgi:hypothetical protein